MEEPVKKAPPTGFDRQFAVEVNGVPTEIVFHPFGQKWFLLITQLNKIPGLFNVVFDVKSEDRSNPYMPGPINDAQFHASVSTTINCCIGKDTDEVRSGIQFLINRTSLSKCPTDLLIGLGLKTIDGPHLRALAKVLDEFVF
ncbi:hypothetical protein KR018_001849 [Drosophila ironensis]|nr:hypothetical protein KR018_001849 [Drosophila ironensis]